MLGKAGKHTTRQALNLRNAGDFLTVGDKGNFRNEIAKVSLRLGVNFLKISHGAQWDLA